MDHCSLVVAYVVKGRSQVEVAFRGGFMQVEGSQVDSNGFLELVDHVVGIAEVVQGRGVFRV